MSISHADCDHPSTSKARATCRRAKGVPTGDGPTSRASKVSRTPKVTKAQRTEAANAKRTAATKKAHPTRLTTEVCFECGSKPGWIDTKNGQPVCMKHVDYDRARIIPL